MTTLEKYLEVNKITKDEFYRVLEKDREYLMNYIEWGETLADTHLSGRAIERLDELLDAESVQTASDSIKTETTETGVSSEPESPINPENTISEEQEEPKKKRKKTAQEAIEKPETRKKKKNKFAVNKTYIAEHGKGEIGDIYSMRQFLLNDGEHKPEDVAMMSDTDIAGYVNKEYYVIAGEKETYLFRREALLSIIGDFCVIEK